MIFRSAQIVLNFPVSAAMGRDDFFASTCNRSALELVESWPVWTTSSAIITGPQGSGKTHLGHIWATRAQAVILDLARDAEMFPEQYAGKTLLLDNADSWIGTPGKEERLFHLHNLAAETGGYLLYLFSIPPARHHDFVLPDLASRLRAARLAAILDPDDVLISALFMKLFQDRQLSLTPDLLSYMMARVERSYAAVHDAVATLDRAALTAQKPLTIPFIRHYLNAHSSDTGD